MNSNQNKKHEKPSVLVVDDEKDILLLFTDIFKERSCKLDTCLTGEEAINRIEKKDYDIVVTDLNLGTISGIDVLRATKKKSPLTEVIIITGYASLKSAIEATEDDAAAYITKPITIQNFLNTFDRVMEKRRLSIENLRLRNSLIKANKYLLEKTKELQKSYEELKNTQKRLIESERLAAIGELTVSVKHEINNPLTSILNSISFLTKLNPDMDPSLKEALDIIERSAFRIKEVLRKIENIKVPKSKKYLKDIMMIDLEEAIKEK